MISEPNSNVKAKLISKFSQFKSKEKMIDYYVDFQFPAKQAQLARWWLQIIQFVIQNKNQIYINFKDLEEIVSINNMKPVPLKKVLQFHKQSQALLKQSDLKSKKEKESTQNQKSWFGGVIQYVWGKSPDPTQAKQFQFSAIQKIISKRVKQQKRHQLQLQFKQEFHEFHSKLLNEILNSLSYKLSINIQSVMLILEQMKEQKIIYIDPTQPNNKVLIFCEDRNKIYDESFLKMQKVQCFLRAQVQKFQKNITKIEAKIDNLRQKAKQCLKIQNQKKARMYLVEIKQLQQNYQNIKNREKLLSQKIFQLQQNEINKSSFELMEQAQKLYRQTAIDQSKFDEISEKNKEIQFQQKERNSLFKQMTESNEDNMQIDDLMKELQQELSNSKPKQKVFIDNNRQVHLVIAQKSNSNNSDISNVVSSAKKNQNIQKRQLNFH